MTALYGYDSSLIQQHIDELRRDADKARLVRQARRRRQRAQADGGRTYRSARPATAR